MASVSMKGMHSTEMPAAIASSSKLSGNGRVHKTGILFSCSTDGIQNFAAAFFQHFAACCDPDIKAAEGIGLFLNFDCFFSIYGKQAAPEEQLPLLNSCEGADRRRAATHQCPQKISFCLHTQGV